VVDCSLDFWNLVISVVGCRVVFWYYIIVVEL